MTKKMTLPTQFPFYATYSNALEKIPEEEDRAKLALSIVEYGAWGKEPDFGTNWVLASVFEAIRINLDNSIQRALAGKKGGCPKKDVDIKQVKKLAKAMKTVYEYEPTEEDADAAFMLEQYEAEREAIRQEAELQGWIG